MACLMPKAAFLALCWSVLALTDGSRILMMPANHGSHVNYFSLVGKALKSVGHEVQVLVSEEQRKLAEKHGVSIISMGDMPHMLSNEDVQRFMFEDASLFKLVPLIANRTNSLCEAVLSQETLMMELAGHKFDLVLIDSIDAVRCMYVIPYRLGVRYITVGYRHDPWSAMVPALPSAEGQLGFFILHSDSSFLDRLKNTIVTTLIQMTMPLTAMINPEYITKYAPNLSPTTFTQLYHNSEMWIINLDTVCLDFPRVQALHYKFIAGLGCEPAKPLPKDMEEFAQASGDNGVIVLTFGSALSLVPEDMMTKLMTAFSKIPQRVFMRYEGTKPKNKPHNVYLSTWLPQNDLLGHTKTRLFIGHGGNNGQMEALYHGVPMLTMPVFGDQLYSAHRSAIHGYGLVLDSKTFTPDQLVADIQEILNNPKYLKNIKKCSDIYRSMPDAHETVIFWVNHVLRFGGSHLKPQYMDMPLWQLFMLDIAAFFIALAGIILVCCWCTCKRLTQKCCRQTSKMENKTKSE